jgi:hypothetical protein
MDFILFLLHYNSVLIILTCQTVFRSSAWEVVDILDVSLLAMTAADNSYLKWEWRLIHRSCDVMNQTSLQSACYCLKVKKFVFLHLITFLVSLHHWFRGLTLGISSLRLVPGQLTALSITGVTVFRLDFCDMSYVLQKMFREMWQRLILLLLVKPQYYLI